MMKKILQNSLIAFISIVFLYIATIFSLIMYFNAPNSYHQADKRFVVDSGMTFRQVVERLYQEKIIKSPSAFLYISQLIKGVDPRVRYGEYFFEKNTSYYKILHKMLHGYIYFRKVTISEGLSINSAKKIIEKSPGLIGQLPEDLKEGMILPETYFYSYNDTKASIAKRMQNALEKNLEELWQKRDPSIPIKSKEKALILASIVEKETGIASERPQVASVFINRLKKGMKLQSDPTIIYSFAFGDKALERPIRVSDIQNNSNYNTYNIYGLPPTPICNPGLASIKAVLNPINSNYLYFVATGKGDHHFSSSIEEHNNYVAKYRAIMRSKEQQKAINVPASNNIDNPQINDSSKVNQNLENKPANSVIDNPPNAVKQEVVSSENSSNI
ncbi:MAG: endolytic transglycosylase MltG [Rickettsiales bacterium]|nr:endolytic transglycosylase MltG [Rickettsiales bacterium]